MKENKGNLNQPNTPPISGSPAEQTPPGQSPSGAAPRLRLSIFFMVMLAAIAITGTVSALFLAKNVDKQKACTMEAKICPDGSSVGRTGPNCEFAPCPMAETDPTANWKIYEDTKQNYSIKYPNNWYIFPNIVGGIIDGYNGTVINSASKLEPHGEMLAEQGEAGIALNVISIDRPVSQSPGEWVKQRGGWLNLNYAEGKINSIPALKAVDSSRVILYLVANKNMVYQINIQNKNSDYTQTVNQILSTFKFIDRGSTVSPSCTPRPACLDANPPCMMPELSTYCPK